MNKAQILLITGTARSGTSALTFLLNSHSRICIGMERYKYQMLQNDNFSPLLFAAKRFMDYHESDTNVLPWLRPDLDSFFHSLEQKVHQAIYIGDKIPNLAPKLQSICKSIPEAKYIYIIRDIRDVASSWNLRANNENDSWPKEFDYLMAAKKWNQHNHSLQKLLDGQDGHRFYIIPYDDFYSGKISILEQLMAFLQLDFEELLRFTYFDIVEDYVKNVKVKPNSLSTMQLFEIKQIVDLPVYEKITQQD